MTSTLPNFLASSPATPAGSGSVNSAALSALVPSTSFPASTAVAANGISCEFASLLPATARPSAPVAPAVVPAPFASPAGASPEAATLITNPQTDLMTETGVAPTLTFVIPGEAIAVEASPSVSEHEPARPHGISRDEFEQAAAFVAALMQTLLPAATPVPTLAPEETLAPAPSVVPSAAGEAEAVSPGESTPVSVAVQSPVQGSVRNPSTAVLPNGRAFPTRLPNEAKVSLGEGRPTVSQFSKSARPTDEALPEQGELPSRTLPNGREFPTEVPEQAKPSLGANRSVPAMLPSQARPNVTVARPRTTEPLVGTEIPAEIPAFPSQEATAGVPTSTAAPATATAPAPVQTAPVFTVAADGAIELKINLPAARENSLKPGAQPVSPLEVSAELEMPGRAVVRVEATVSEAHGFNEPTPPVNFAGPRAAEKSSSDKPAEVFERNFVFTGDKRVKTASPESGITVAKTGGKMPVAPTEETRTARNPETFSALPFRADFQVVQSPTERITVAPTEPAGQNFAERAVATVTGLAEAQFSASMSKAGSVQLRLKFGGEDLSVRVELRDGAVHTDFRTDSPALRDALAKEWQAVAASSPGQLQHFLDPVFSPASISSSTDAGAQQQASYRQSPQQQAHEQAANRQDAWHSQSPFSRRSALSESFVPEPAAPRVPVLLPTSLRLSVLA